MLVNIQVLRAAAAYLVVIVHLATLLAAVGVISRATLVGNCGVDLFFVISGYLMALTTEGKSVSAAQFMINRLIRVVPMYWICTTAVFTIALVVPGALSSTSASMNDLTKSLMFIPFQKQNGLIEPIFFLGWTLNYEMFFYFIFSASLFITARRAAIPAMSAIVGLALFGTVTSPASIIGRFYTDPIILEFVMGMALALLLDRSRPLSPAAAWTLVAAGTLVMVARYQFVPLGSRTWWSGGPATAILYGAISLEKRGLVWRNGFVQLLGAASYSLYLVHPFVLQTFTKLLPVGKVGGSPALLIGVIPLLFAAAGAAAIALHLVVERPVTRRLRELIGHRVSKAGRGEAAPAAARAGKRS